MLQEAARNEGFVASYDVKQKPRDPRIVLLARVAAWLTTMYVLFTLIITSVLPVLRNEYTGNTIRPII